MGKLLVLDVEEEFLASSVEQELRAPRVEQDVDWASSRPSAKQKTNSLAFGAKSLKPSKQALIYGYCRYGEGLSKREE
jgi:hypothetical protein